MSDMPDAPPPIRVLHLEDSPRDAEIIRAVLEASGTAYDVVQVNGRAPFESALASGAFDVVICDFNLPDLDGLTALSLAKNGCLDIPVIIVSGAIDPGEAVRCLQEGATDFVLKERLERLPSAVTRAIEEAELRRQRQQLDAKLRESEERFRQLAEQSSDGFWFIGLNPERILYVSPAAERIWGLSAARFQQDRRVWLDVIHADDQTRMREVRKTWAKGGALRFEVECRVVRPDGSVRWVLNSGTPIRNDAGAITGLSGLTQDITERKQAEEALRQSDAFSRAVLNSLSYHIAVLDAQGTIVATNQAWEVFAIANGGNQHTIRPMGTNYLSVVEASIRGGDAAAQAALDGIRAVLNGARETLVLEYPCHSPDKQRWFVMRVSPKSDKYGGVVVAHQDITERMELEGQFRQAQKMESVGRLAGGIAHDFNNLLTIINGTTELALMEMGDAEVLRADLVEIRKAGERAAALTKQLLAFSRKQILQPRVLSLAATVTNAESLLRRLIGEDIDLVVSQTESLGNIKADPGQLEQVLVNLVLNARDAMPRGGRLTIETRNVELDEADSSTEIAVSPGPYVMLAVDDTGVGMDEITRRRLFEPFFTTKGPDKGTGLGLSTVYGIVMQSGGTISVRSEFDRGTTFKIYLPRVAEPMGLDRPAPAVTVTAGTETILLVEDNQALRALARRILVSAGYTVLVAGYGQEALLALKRHKTPVHLLLTDVVMPGMDGNELARRCREIRPGLKVLYASGYTDDALLRHGVLEQEISFVSKPFTVAELTRRVREVLES
jgi:PAS domain S-box-containing protein